MRQGLGVRVEERAEKSFRIHKRNEKQPSLAGMKRTRGQWLERLEVPPSHLINREGVELTVR